jgi:anaerobic selenocysteine-containing dehydrogenase
MSSNIKTAVVDYARQTSLKEALASMGIRKKGREIVMPHYEEPEQIPNESDYPLSMVPYEMINLASGWASNPPFLKKTLFDDQLLKGDSFAEIHPKTAADHQLKEGDRVMVKSPAGKIQARVHLSEGAMPGVVFLPLGLGHTALDEFSRGQGANPLDIIDAGKDPLSGLPVWWKTPVQLIKV